MTKPVAFVIHMAKSKARQPLIDAMAAHLPPHEIIDAVDGRALSAVELSAVYQTELSQPRYPFALNPAEVGAFLSHRKVWTALIESGANWAFVAEDDIALEPAFEDARSLAEAHIARDKLIRFPISNREVPRCNIASADGVELFVPKVVGLGAQLYMVGRDAAKRLLRGSEKFDRPVDTWMQMRWETKVDSQAIWPSYVKHAANSHGGSTIQIKHKGLAKLKRELNRTVYRAAVRRFSKSR